jgi:glycosyltransferase involved in cell wall biosynthesis
MRVGFDVSPLSSPHPRGVVRVVAGLVAALERRGRLEIVRLAPGPGAHSARWRQVELPRAEARLGLTGIHCCVSAFPLRGAGKRAQTLHELPWLHGVAENAGWRHRLWARLGPRRADLVFTATERTALDVRTYSGVDARRVRVVPWGLDASFAGAADAHDEEVLRRHGIARGRFVLCAGGGRAKKRLDAAQRGAIQLGRRGGANLALVVTGAVEDSVGSAGGALFVGDVTDAELAALYRNAAAVAVLSRSEGFGLPALEACAAGAPVLVARDSAQAEVTGNAGISVDPDDASSVAEGLRRALDDTPEARRARVERAAEFTWDRCAASVESAWLEIAG